MSLTIFNILNMKQRDFRKLVSVLDEDQKIKLIKSMKKKIRCLS